MRKICKECGLEKELVEFEKGDLWYRNECKDCRRKFFRKNYQKTKEKYNLHRKKYLKTHPEMKSKMKRKWRNENPEKERAYNILLYAIKTSKIIRKSCSICGDKNSHGHHEDYSKPLDVIWLCLIHHRELHQYKLSIPLFTNLTQRRLL